NGDCDGGEQWRPEPSLVHDERGDPGPSGTHADAATRRCGAREAAAHAPEDRHEIGERRREHHLEPAAEVVRVDEWTRGAAAERLRPDEGEHTDRLLHEPESGHEDSPGKEGQDERAEDLVV